VASDRCNPRFLLRWGQELALCCDIRYAEETAQLGFPEVNLSVFPGNGGIWCSLYHISLGKLKELVFTGEMIGATEAFGLGLIEKVVPPGQVMEATMELAAKPDAGSDALGIWTTALKQGEGCRTNLKGTSYIWLEAGGSGESVSQSMLSRSGSWHWCPRRS
jgi:enoyl-CoA hydratase/carnithine racemase